MYLYNKEMCLLNFIFLSHVGEFALIKLHLYTAVISKKNFDENRFILIKRKEHFN